MRKIFLFIFCTILSNHAFTQTSFELTAHLSNNDVIAGVAENASGDFVFVTTTYVGSNYDITLVKISSLGVIIASKKIGTSVSEIAKSVCATADGGYFITGYTFTSPSDNDALLIKVDS